MLSTATLFNIAHIEAFAARNQNECPEIIALLRDEAANYCLGATACFTEGNHEKGCENIINALAHLSLALKIQYQDIDTTF